MEPATHSAAAADASDGPSKFVPFHRVVPYAIAACLMAIGISQALQIVDLKKKLATSSTETARLRQTVALMSLRVAMLEAKDPTYASSKIMIAWDAYLHRGVLALQDLSAPPAGHDYQLWVLDPNALGPISAGLITGGKSFDAQQITTDNPGFAVSLEPTGGSPAPTGPILFAVAPGP
jgi:anti-sigma-K factor RskA